MCLITSWMLWLTSLTRRRQICRKSQEMLYWWCNLRLSTEALQLSQWEQQICCATISNFYVAISKGLWYMSKTHFHSLSCALTSWLQLILLDLSRNVSRSSCYPWWIMLSHTSFIFYLRLLRHSFRWMNSFFHDSKCNWYKYPLVSLFAGTKKCLLNVYIRAAEETHWMQDALCTHLKTVSTICSCHVADGWVCWLL